MLELELENWRERAQRAEDDLYEAYDVIDEINSEIRELNKNARD